MSIAKKLLFAAFAAALLLALAGGTAAALRSLTSNRREIALLSRALSLGSAAGGTQVICEVALNTTLTQLSNAKREAVVGRVTAVVLRCSRGTARVLNTPWNVLYVTFGGTLPTITSITNRVVNSQFLVEYGSSLENRCLIEAETEGPQEVVGGNGGTLGNLVGLPFNLRNVSVVRLGGLCPFFAAEARMNGTFEPVNGPITVTLS